MAEIVTYAPALSEPPSKLTLETDPHFIKLTFPVPPRWMYCISIVMQVISGAAQLMLLAFITRFQIKWGTTTSNALWRTLTVVWLLVVPALISWTAAVIHFVTYRRFGRVPRVLTADAQGLCLSRLIWFRIRERSWARDEILDVDVRPIRGDINPFRRASILSIYFSSNRRKRYRISSKDATLGGAS